MLTLYRRHAPPCRHTSRQKKNCKCAIWVQGSLGGEYLRKSLDIRSWEAASDLVRGWEASGELGVVKVEIPDLDGAVTLYLADCKARHLSDETLRKYKALLVGRLIPWARSKGYTRLKQLSVEVVREFRGSWSDGPNYASKNLEKLKAFFRFCVDAGWLKTNPATPVKAPKFVQAPTLPFTDQEFKRILDACDEYPGNKARIKAFVLVMRYSGLRISDTISLRRDAVVDGKIRLRTEKTNTDVYVPVPPKVVAALDALPDQGERFFWNGKGKLKTRVANWSRYLDTVFTLAKVEGAHSHRFRHAFSVSLLQKGVSVENVATLLGNSPKVVMKHYSPWIAERQSLLEAAVMKTW